MGKKVNVKTDFLLNFEGSAKEYRKTALTQTKFSFQFCTERKIEKKI